MSHREATLMCPRCDTPLVALGGAPVHLCRECAGVWFGKARYQGVLDELSVGVRTLLAKRADVVAAEINHAMPVDCPACSTELTRRRVTDRSIEIDVCKEHGIWFDRGELNRVSTWVYEKREGDSDDGETSSDSGEWFARGAYGVARALGAVLEIVLRVA
jgi:Zn-finger nucleic acid-binding protein